MGFFKTYIQNTFIQGRIYEIVYSNSYYFVIGNLFTNDDSSMIMKLDINGNVIFKRSLKIEGVNTLAFNMTVVNDGNIIISGNLQGIGTNAFVLKLGYSSGNILWIKKLTSSFGNIGLSTYTEKINNNRFVSLSLKASIVSIFSESGDLIVSKRLWSENSLIGRGVYSSLDGSKILFTCHDSNSVDPDQGTVLIVTDSNLNLLNSLRIPQLSDNLFEQDAAFINNNEIVFQGQIGTSSNASHYLIKWNINDSTPTLHGIFFPAKYGFNHRSFLFQNNKIYLSFINILESNKDGIAIFDTNLNFIEANGLDEDGEININRSGRLNFGVLSSNGNELISVVEDLNSAILVSNDQIDTCITVPRNIAYTDYSRTTIESIVSITDVSYAITTPTYTLGSYPNESISIHCDDIPEVDLELSTITASPTEIIANGTSTSVITVTLKDEDGVTIDSSPYNVTIDTTVGTWQTSVQTTGNGIYTRTLRSSTTEETALLQFTVQGVGQGEDTATVEFIEPGSIINIKDNTALQSPHLYLQAAGSNGQESTRGRHLRWALRGALGEKHLPKGSYATSNVNFNKPKDYVRIYRAAYTKKVVHLNFIEHSPQVVDNTNYLWIYRIGDKDFNVRFSNTIKYNQLLTTINPLSQSTEFLIAYVGEILEIESATGLFFAATCNFNPAFSAIEPTARIETLSVEADTPISNRIVSNRRNLSGNIGSSLRLLCENGKIVRGYTTGLHIGSIDFEFYDVLINDINSTTGWDELGDYALTLNTSTAYKQLEPSPGDVHGIWQRFNDDAYVNINNYHKRWEGSVEAGDRNIKQVVDKYISLSNQAANPTAVESIPLGNDPNDPTDYVSISNLDLLNIAANDYHIARLLGLGILDISTPQSFQTKDNKTGRQVSIQAYKSPLYVYVAEYYTVADLEDGQGKRDVHHLFMSLPTSDATSRLPLPVDLNNIETGLSIGDMILTDEDGYTHDGLSRYVRLYNENLPEDQINVPFFNSSNYINLSAITDTVYGGLEYKMNLEEEWRKPELPKDIRYENAVPQGEQPHFESRFLIIPSDNNAYHTHRQRASGMHHYSSYGINWFSRARSSGSTVSINTLLRPKNPLLPPSNAAALLIRSESPLLLTSAHEQNRLSEINLDEDRTLIRLSFDYHSYHELKNHQISVDDSITNEELIADTNSIYPDNDEIFAENIDIFFRNEVPNNIIGKALTVVDHNSEETLSIIQTGDYFIASTGQTVVPTVTPGTEDNYIGGFFTMGTDNYLIQAVTQSAQGPKFTVYKKEITESIVNGGMPSNQTNGELVSPEIIGDGYFMAFENMQTPDNWESPNPNSFKITVGNNWGIHREVITLVDDDGIEDRYLEKTRGIWSDSGSNHTTIESLDENGNVSAQNTGLYRITFHGIQLNEHSQYNENGVSVEWSSGIVRLFTESTVNSGIPTGSRKVLPVLKIENVIRQGQTAPFNDLVIYAQDGSFDPTDTDYDAIQTGNNIEANFYPGYKVYLYSDPGFGLTENNILPSEGEGMRYSIFGFRSHDTDDDFLSRISVPAVMYAQELIEALPPEQPEGGVYATRPDFYGRSTYTFTTKYQHKPHGVLFYRTNDEALLNSLYEKATVREIREQLSLLGGNNEEYLNNRWQNFMNFGELETDGDYKVYPPVDVSNDGYKFPNPDKVSLYEWANNILGELGQPLITESPGDLAVGDPKILHFVKGYIYNAFAPLAEIPILYQYLNDSEYQPIAKKQVVYDRNGHILPPVDPKTLGPDDEVPEFDMAPMMKIIGNTPNETLFTDFTLDGTSNNLYFYGAKELSTQMKMSDFSPFLGPIKLVNTNAPETPEIKRIMPVLANNILGISPKIQLEINAYPTVQNIKKLTIYRSTNRLAAQSVRTMDIVKVIDLETENLLGNPIWTVTDAFEDLSEVPYGNPLFYRITASREVEYADKDGNIITEYAPSKSSKISASAIVEVANPISPTLSYTSDPITDDSNELHNIVLEWNKTCFNGKYHLYKMNSNGNWNKIHELTTNDNVIQVPLLDTDLSQDNLLVVNNEGLNIYHHFRVIAENTSGMLSTQENILTIPNTEISNSTGIGSITIGSTFTISN